MKTASVRDLSAPLAAGVMVYAVGVPLEFVVLFVLARAMEWRWGAVGVLLLFWMGTYLAGGAAIVLRGRSLIRAGAISWEPVIWSLAIYFAPAVLLTTSLLLFNEVVGGVKPREEIDEFFFMSAPYLLLYVLALAVVVRRLHWRLAHGAMAFLAAEVLIVGVLVYRLCEASPEFQYRSSWELSLDGVTLERLPGRPEDSHAQLTIDATVVVKADGEFVYQSSCLDWPLSNDSSWHHDTDYWPDLLSYHDQPRRPGTYRVRLVFDRYHVRDTFAQRKLIMYVQPRHGASRILKELQVDVSPDVQSVNR